MPLKSYASAALVLLVSSCGKGGDFEGRVTMTVARAGAPSSEMVFETAAGHVRLAMTSAGAGAGGYALVRPDGLAVFVSEADKAWSDLSMAKSRVAMAEANPPGTGAPTIKRTGRQEKVADQSCEVWEIAHTSGKRTEACIAQNFIGFDFGSLMPGAGPFAGGTDDVKKEKLFPMRSVEYDAAGKETSRMIVTRVEKTRIDKARFDVPKDYAYAKK